MIVVITNRQVNPAATDETLFGESPNQKGPDELRLATARFANGTWQLELLPETDLEATPPSQQLFTQILADIRADRLGKRWVLYIHGFNQSFLRTLEASRAISQLYDVEVLVFSWPSNPGGFVTDEYKRARQAARASVNALDRTLAKLSHYLLSRPWAEMRDCPVNLSLLAHSMGNYLVESFARSPIFLSDRRIFDNVILHQADVDNARHRFWVRQLTYSRRTYVTINENDRVLKASDLINPGRLGNTLKNLDTAGIHYVDFTSGQGIKGAHNLFLEVLENPSAREFFQRVLTGERGESTPGFSFDPVLNAYQLQG